MEKAIAVPVANARAVQMEIRQAAVVRSRLGIFQNVPHSADCMNKRACRGMVHFPAQAVNMDVHDIGRRIDPHFPYVIENHGPGHDPARIPAKIF